MKKLFLIIFCGVMLFSSFGCASTGKQTTASTMEENAVLIDVRNPDEFKTGHLNGAINLPQADVETMIDRIVPDKETPVYVYCRGGREATMAAEKLQKLGYSTIYNLGAMKDAQKTLGLPVKQ